MKLLKDTWSLTVGVLLINFIFGKLIVDPLGYKSVALLFLASVSILAVLVELKQVLVAATLSALIWNFFFIPPLYTFHIEQSDDIVLFTTYFFIAFVASILTSRIRKQRRLLEHRRTEERRMELYETIINSISHELKTPLAVMQSGVEMLRNEPVSGKGEAIVDELDISVKRLNFQLNNLLNMSQVESGLTLIKPSWIDLPELLFRVRRMESKEVQSCISVVVPEDFPLVLIDESKLEIILHNLVHNAVIHNSSSVNVAVRAEVDAIGLRCVVEDDGVGIPIREQPYLFDKFFRGAANRSQGSGLGLSIVKGFADLMNGTLHLKSTEAGTSFELLLPCEFSYLNKMKNE